MLTLTPEQVAALVHTLNEADAVLLDLGTETEDPAAEDARESIAEALTLLGQDTPAPLTRDIMDELARLPMEGYASPSRVCIVDVGVENDERCWAVFYADGEEARAGDVVAYADMDPSDCANDRLVAETLARAWQGHLDACGED